MGSSMPLGPPPDPLGNHPLSRARSSGMPDVADDEVGPHLGRYRVEEVAAQELDAVGHPMLLGVARSDLHHVRSGVGGVDLRDPSLAASMASTPDPVPTSITVSSGDTVMFSASIRVTVLGRRWSRRPRVSAGPPVC